MSKYITPIKTIINTAINSRSLIKDAHFDQIITLLFRCPERFVVIVRARTAPQNPTKQHSVASYTRVKPRAQILSIFTEDEFIAKYKLPTETNISQFADSTPLYYQQSEDRNGVKVYFHSVFHIAAVCSNFLIVPIEALKN